MKKSENVVVDYFKKLLDSEKRTVIDRCYYTIRDEENRRYFKESIVLMEDSKFDSLFPLVSLVVLTANKIESDCLNYIVSKQEGNDLVKRRHSLPIFEKGDLASPDAYLFKICSSYVLHLNAYETGANTFGGSADLVRFVSNNLFIQPSCIISFGVCYGRDLEKQNIGDVLIPKKLYPWSIGQKITDSKFYIKHDNFNLWLEDKFSESGIYSVLNDFCNGEDGKVITNSINLVSGYEGKEREEKFSIKVTWGNMSTGEAVVSSKQAKKMIREAANNEKELGGEMEGYGIAKECIFYAHIPCFILKAICDWGECKDIDKKLKEEGIESPINFKDQLQAYATFCAGITFIQLLTDEKEKFLSLKLIEWMEDSKRRYSIKKHIYEPRERFIKNIKDFYSVSDAVANKIFAIFIDNDVIKSNQSGDKYCIKIQ